MVNPMVSCGLRVHPLARRSSIIFRPFVSMQFSACSFFFLFLHPSSLHPSRISTGLWLAVVSRREIIVCGGGWSFGRGRWGGISTFAWRTRAFSRDFFNCQRWEGGREFQGFLDSSVETSLNEWENRERIYQRVVIQLLYTLFYTYISLNIFACRVKLAK